MEDNRIIDRNRKVFDSFPDTPYLGHVPEYGTGSSRILKWITVAAAVLAIPLAVYTISDMLEAEAPVTSVATAAISQRTYTVNNGVKGKVVLPDSTEVRLNSGSTLILADDYEYHRSVGLVGEGYFDVKADRERPFIINTGKGITVKVTGTEFNLSCYYGEREVKLSLVNGSVELMKGNKTLYRMNGREEVSICDGDVKVVDDKVEEAIAWTKGSLVFDDTPMNEVLKKIERWYGVNITVEDLRIYNSSFTGDFRSESVDQVLELMSITSGFRYKINGNEIHLML